MTHFFRSEIRIETEILTLTAKNKQKKNETKKNEKWFLAKYLTKLKLLIQEAKRETSHF
jgi:hypothetical protein